jgi:hypothetical protein
MQRRLRRTQRRRSKELRRQFPRLAVQVLSPIGSCSYRSAAASNCRNAL